MAVAKRKNTGIINGTTVRSRFQRTSREGRWMAFIAGGGDRRKEARVSFNNYERLNVSRAANTKDLIYNDGWFNWIEQLRSYKITTRNNCVVSNRPSRAGFTLRIRGLVTPGAFTSRVKYWRAVHKSKFHSRGMELLHFTGCVLVGGRGGRTIIFIARNRIALNRISDYSERKQSLVSPLQTRNYLLVNKNTKRDANDRSENYSLPTFVILYFVLLLVPLFTTERR